MSTPQIANKAALLIAGLILVAITAAIVWENAKPAPVARGPVWGEAYMVMGERWASRDLRWTVDKKGRVTLDMILSHDARRAQTELLVITDQHLRALCGAGLSRMPDKVGAPVARQDIARLQFRFQVDGIGDSFVDGFAVVKNGQCPDVVAGIPI